MSAVTSSVECRMRHDQYTVSMFRAALSYQSTCTTSPSPANDLTAEALQYQLLSHQLLTTSSCYSNRSWRNRICHVTLRATYRGCSRPLCASSATGRPADFEATRYQTRQHPFFASAPFPATQAPRKSVSRARLYVYYACTTSLSPLVYRCKPTS